MRPFLIASTIARCWCSIRVWMAPFSAPTSSRLRYSVRRAARISPPHVHQRLDERLAAATVLGLDVVGHAIELDVGVVPGKQRACAPPPTPMLREGASGTGVASKAPARLAPCPAHSRPPAARPVRHRRHADHVPGTRRRRTRQRARSHVRYPRAVGDVPLLRQDRPADRARAHGPGRPPARGGDAAPAGGLRDLPRQARGDLSGERRHAAAGVRELLADLAGRGRRRARPPHRQHRARRPHQAARGRPRRRTSAIGAFGSDDEDPQQPRAGGARARPRPLGRRLLRTARTVVVGDAEADVALRPRRQRPRRRRRQRLDRAASELAALAPDALLDSLEPPAAPSPPSSDESARPDSFLVATPRARTRRRAGS